MKKNNFCYQFNNKCLNFRSTFNYLNFRFRLNLKNLKNKMKLNVCTLSC